MGEILSIERMCGLSWRSVRLLEAAALAVETSILAVALSTLAIKISTMAVGAAYHCASLL